MCRMRLQQYTVSVILDTLREKKTKKKPSRTPSAGLHKLLAALKDNGQDTQRQKHTKTL